MPNFMRLFRGSAMNSSEAAFEIAAFSEFMNNGLDNGTHGPLFGLVVFGITLAGLFVRQNYL